MSLFNKTVSPPDTKEKTLAYKSVLDSLLLQTDLLKGEYNLKKIYDTIGTGLLKAGVSSFFTVVDNKRDLITLKHFYVPDSVPRSSVNTLNNKALNKKFNIERYRNYSNLIAQKKPLFVEHRTKEFYKIFSKYKNVLALYANYNALIVPLVIKNEVIGVLEFVSPKFKNKDLELFVEFSEKLMNQISKLVLFHEATKSEKRYKDLFERSDIGYLIFNTEHKNFIDANNKIVQISEYTPDELKQLNYLLLFHKNERVKVESIISNYINNISHKSPKNVSELETILLTKKQKERIVTLSISSTDNPSDWFISVSDITEKKIIEEELKKSQEKKYQKLYSSMNEGVALHNIIHDKTGKAVDYQIIDVNPAYESITGISKSEALKHKASMLYKAGEPPYLDIFAKVAKTMKSTSFKVYFSPLKKHFTISVFSPGRGQFATVFQDISEQVKTQDDLRKSKEQFRAIAETTSDWLWEVDENGIYTYSNPKSFDILGYKPEEIIGKTPFDFMEKKEAKKILSIFTDILKKESPIENLINKTVHKNGHTVILETSGVPIYDKENNFIGYRGIDRDITKREEDKRALKHSENTLKSIFRAAPTGIGLTVNRNIKWVNEQLCEMTGYREKELVGQNGVIFYPNKKEYDRVGEIKYPQIIKTGTGTIETIWKKKNGDIINVLLSSSAIDHDNLEKGVTFTALDITNRKKAELALSKLNIGLEKKVKERTQKLKMSESRFKNLWNKAPVAYHTLNTEGIITAVNETEARLLGYKKSEMIGKPIFDFISPEQRESAKKRFEQKLAGVTVDRNIDRTYVKKDGSKIHVSIEDNRELDSDGNVVAIRTTMFDITKEYSAQIALEQSEQMLNGIVESMTDPMVMIDENRTVCWANGRAKNVLGKNIIGKKCHQVYHGSENACEICLSSKAFTDGKFHEKETKILDVHGNVRDVWSSVNIVAKHVNGKPKLVIEILRDITKRKKSENEIKRNTETRKILNKILSISLKENSIKNILEETMDCLLSVSWMALEGKGGIWLTDHNTNNLKLIVNRGIDKKTTITCSSLPGGICVYGNEGDGAKDNNAGNVQKHYCAPIVLKHLTLGAINLYLKPEYVVDKKDISFLKSVANVLANVIEKNNTKTKLLKSEERYRGLINNARDGVVVIGLDGKFKFSNSAFSLISGYKQKELSDINFFDIIHPSDQEKFKQFFEREKNPNNRKEIIEFKIIDKAKNVKYVSYFGSQILKNSKLNGFQAIIRDINENKLLQKKIEYSKNHYEQIIDTIQDSICVIDNNFRITGCNKAFANNVGMNIEKIINKKCKNILPRFNKGFFSEICCSAESIKKNECLIINAFETGQAASLIKTTKTANLENVYHRINMFPAKDNQGKIYQIVMTIRDVSSVHKAEEEIRKLSEFNMRILDNVPVSIMTMDKKGNITSANSFIKNISKSENHVGKNIFEIPFYKKRNLANKYQDLLTKSKAFTKSNVKTINRKGEIKYLNLTAVPLKDSEGNIEGAISMAHDNTDAVITKAKVEKLNEELEKKVVQRTWQLDHANKELSKVLDLKSKFISDASHELRTPLTIAQGNLDLAIQEAKHAKKEVPELYNIVCREIRQMADILGDLTMLTNADSQTEYLAYEPIDINKLLLEVSSSLSVLAKPKNIKISTKNTEKGLTIKGDEDKIEKLLINIVRNAIKYTGKNGKINLQTEVGENEVRIIIEDNGIGIPEQDLPYIFERFYRVDKARSRTEGGTGLGLSICKWIAEAHGGYINVQSKINKGTKFIVHLPKEHKKTQITPSLF